MTKVKLPVLIVVVMLVIVVPASAAQPVPVGERIDLFGNVHQFPEAEPFHVAHGWDIDPTAGYPMGLFSFELTVNDNLIEPDFILTEHAGSSALVTRVWVYNFAGGLRAFGLFTGRWYAPCQAAVDYGYYQGQCSDRTEVVEAFAKTIFVEFTP